MRFRTLEVVCANKGPWIWSLLPSTVIHPQEHEHSAVVLLFVWIPSMSCWGPLSHLQLQGIKAILSTSTCWYLLHVRNTAGDRERKESHSLLGDGAQTHSDHQYQPSFPTVVWARDPQPLCVSLLASESSFPHRLSSPFSQWGLGTTMSKTLGGFWIEKLLKVEMTFLWLCFPTPPLLLHSLLNIKSLPWNELKVIYLSLWVTFPPNVPNVSEIIKMTWVSCVIFMHVYEKFFFSFLVRQHLYPILFM